MKLWRPVYLNATDTQITEKKILNSMIDVVWLFYNIFVMILVVIGANLIKKWASETTNIIHKADTLCGDVKISKKVRLLRLSRSSAPVFIFDFSIISVSELLHAN